MHAAAALLEPEQPKPVEHCPVRDESLHQCCDLGHCRSVDRDVVLQHQRVRGPTLQEHLQHLRVGDGAADLPIRELPTVERVQLTLCLNHVLVGAHGALGQNRFVVDGRLELLAGTHAPMRGQPVAGRVLRQ